MATAKSDAPENQEAPEIKQKPTKPTPSEGGGVTLEDLKAAYNEGLPLEPVRPDGKIAKNTSGELRAVSPQEVADYYNVDVYYVLQAVDPDWRPDPAFEEGEE